MKKEKISKIILLFYCFSYYVLAGDKVGNGGGLSEHNIWYADSNLKQSIDLCLLSCSLNQKEKFLLEKVKISLPKEHESKEHIVFKSGKKNPGFFLIDDVIKVAKTGSDVGDTIYINTDLLYDKKSDGSYGFFTIASATALLVHEYGHHHGDYDHAFLNYLGTKVSSVFLKNTQQVKLLPFSNRLSMFIVNSDFDNFPSLYFYTKKEALDFSSLFKNHIVCPSNGHTVWKSWKRGGLPTGSVLHNVYWKDVSFERLEFELSGELAVRCTGSNTKGLKDSYIKYYRAKIEFRLMSESFHNKKLLNLRYRPNSFRAKVRNLSLWEGLDPEVINHR